MKVSEKELATLLRGNPDIVAPGTAPVQRLVEVSARECKRVITVTVANERAPSWNGVYAGMHWTKRTALVANIWAKMRDLLPVDVGMFGVPVDVSIVATYRGQVVDSDNVVAKVYLDCFKGKLIRDDDPRYVRRVTTESRKGKANSVVITLTPVKGDA